MGEFRTRYEAGVNLGGWLSQYGSFDHDHFERFITEADIERIAGWGMDHVRLPVDDQVLVDASSAGGYDDRGFGYLDACLDWCRANDLGVIFDLHQAPGYSFLDPEDSRLFYDDALQDRFVDLWRAFARRYQSAGEDVVFELLNEVVDPPPARWRQLVRRTVDAIREIDPERTVIVGGPYYSAVDAIDEIELLDHDDVVYTFHFYKPALFTHQGASWLEVTDKYTETVEYPGQLPELGTFLDEYPEYESAYGQFVGERIDRDWLEDALEPAATFCETTGAELYCGEFGVIDQAPIESRIAWHRDVIDILDELGIGRACWSYREMNFELVDADREVVSEELIDVVSGSQR